MVYAEVLQGVHDMESSSPPKRVAADRSDDDRKSVCYGVRVDDQREHQRVCDGTSGCESV